MRTLISYKNYNTNDKSKTMYLRKIEIEFDTNFQQLRNGKKVNYITYIFNKICCSLSTILLLFN